MKHFLYLMAMMGVLIVSAKEHLQKEALDSNAKKTFAAVTKMLPENGAVDVKHRHATDIGDDYDK